MLTSRQLPARLPALIVACTLVALALLVADARDEGAARAEFTAPQAADSDAPESLPRLQGGVTLTPGEAMAWGSNAQGQVGSSTCTPIAPVICHFPVAVEEGAGLTAEVVAIAAGGSASSNGHSLAVLDDGTVWSWGNDSFGQLGNDGSLSSKSSPVQVAGITTAIAVAAGGHHSLALLANGTVKSWGSDQYGQLGNGGASTNTGTPVTVSGLATVTEIAAGGVHSLALLNDGTVRAWGRDSDGQLGEGAGSDNQQAPVTVVGLSGVIDVAAGLFHSLAARSGANVATWGNDAAGQLGNGPASTSDQHSFVTAALFAVEVAAGASHSLARTPVSALQSWGSDSAGQLGNGSGFGNGSKDAPSAVALPAGTAIAAIAAGGNTSLGLAHPSAGDQGRVLAWGSDATGALGNGGGTTANAQSPIAVAGTPGVGGVVAIALGQGHAIAVRALCDGTPATIVDLSPPDNDPNSVSVIDGTAGADVIVGSVGEDSIDGLAGDDIICGGDANDSIDGGTGDNQLFGGLGNDTVTFPDAAVIVNLQNGAATQGSDSDTLSSFINVRGSEGNDTIAGNTQANTILGLGGDDTLSGGAFGSDTFNGGAGADDYNGGSGSGTDTVVYNLAAGNSLDVDLGAQEATIGGTATENLVLIEHISSVGQSDDTIVGDGADNILKGGSGDDILNGAGGADTLLGEGGDDELDGGAGLDNLDGGGGANSASYPDGPVVVDLNLNTAQTPSGAEQAVNIQDAVGSPLNDRLIGGAEDSRLEGGEGDDTLVRTTGNEDYLGGPGSDTIDVVLLPSPAQINLDTGANNLVGDTLNSIENIIGTANSDTLVGNSEENNIQGMGGDDLINGRAADDALDGGDGLDTISYEGLLVPLTLNLGSQTNNQGDTLAGFENAIGSSAADTLTGNSSANVIEGAGDNDTIKGGNGNDTLSGGPGNDTIDGGEGADILGGGDDVDTLSHASFRRGVALNLGKGSGDAGDDLSGFENIEGSNFDDTITGDANPNTIEGLDGDDLIDGSDGPDILDGGIDLDMIVYSEATGPVTLNLGDGGNNQGDTLANFENARGSPVGDNLTGDGNPNAIDGGAGNDTIIGLGGSDRLKGESGNDSIDGGEGADNLDGGNNSDSISYASSSIGVQLNLASGANNQGDTIAGVENVNGSPLGDTLTGNASVNVLNGGGGNDVLDGGGAADTLDGGPGVNTISYASATAAVTVNLGANSNSQGDTLANFANITGSPAADTLTGNANANVINGLGGNDVLRGGDGSDRLNGGEGGDTLNGGTGADRLDGGASADTVDYLGSPALTIDLRNGSNNQGDTVLRVENVKGSNSADSITGNGAGNVLDGQKGGDTIAGLGGPDNLLGRGGNDSLTGGPGADSCDGGAGNNTAKSCETVNNIP